MAIITFNEIIEVNGILEQKHLNFKLHLRDACGAQALWIEPLGNCACEGHYDEMHQMIEQYFLDKGLNVKYWDDGPAVAKAVAEAARKTGVARI